MREIRKSRDSIRRISAKLDNDTPNPSVGDDTSGGASQENTTISTDEEEMRRTMTGSKQSRNPTPGSPETPVKPVGTTAEVIIVPQDFKRDSVLKEPVTGEGETPSTTVSWPLSMTPREQERRKKTLASRQHSSVNFHDPQTRAKSLDIEHIKHQTAIA